MLPGGMDKRKSRLPSQKQYGYNLRHTPEDANESALLKEIQIYSLKEFFTRSFNHLDVIYLDTISLSQLNQKLERYAAKDYFYRISG